MQPSVDAAGLYKNGFYPHEYYIIANQRCSGSVGLALLEREVRRSMLTPLIRAHLGTTECNYIAGLWAEDSHGLLWLKDRSKRKKDGVETYHSYPWESENYRAPSWSWAAVEGPVAFASYDEERTFSANDATIVNHRVRPQGSSKFGAVLTGSLTLRALSKNVQCLSENKSPEYYIDDFIAEHCQLDHKYYKAGIPDKRYTLRIFDEIGKEFGLGICDDDVMGELVIECVVVWIGEYVYDGRIPTKAVYFLLIALDDEEPEKWRRLGMGVTKDDPNLQGFSQLCSTSMIGRNLC